MEAYPLAVRPLAAERRAAPIVDLRHELVTDDDFADRDPWAWCKEYTRRHVVAASPANADVVGLTLKEFDLTRGADQAELAEVIAALDAGRPVAFYGWWPTAETASTSPTLGVDALDVPTPDRKGSALVDGHAVVVVGYGRHDAFPGGGYFVVRNPWAAAGWGDDGVGYLPFTYVRAYGTALWTAQVEQRSTSGAEAPALDPDLALTGADADREIARHARCADPRSSYTALFFSENAFDTLRAKAICSVCSVRQVCLTRALERREPYGVWGGEFLEDGAIVTVKRGRGRPSRTPLPTRVDEVTGAPLETEIAVA